MDRDVERFARLAERAKLPPFTPLDNLLVNGNAVNYRVKACDCGCGINGRIARNYRIKSALEAMRARKGGIPTSELESVDGQPQFIAEWGVALWQMSNEVWQASEAANQWSAIVTGYQRGENIWASS